MRSRRITSALITAALLLGTAAALLSCGNRGPFAFEYKSDGESAGIDEKQYAYWVAHYKHVFLSSYKDAEDTQEFWDSTLDNGQNAEKYLTSVVNKNVARYVAAAWMFDYMGLKLTSVMKKEVEDGIEEIVTYSFDSDEEKFNEYLAGLGIDRQTLYDAYIMDVKLNAVKEAMYGVSGVINVPDSDRMTYLKDNYIRICHIYVNDKFKFRTDENGTYVTDENGLAIRDPLTEEEAAEAEETIEAIRDALDSGEDFEKVWEEYSEDQLYPKGYYLLPTTPLFEGTELVATAFELEVGEMRELETEYGVHFIKRYEPEGTPWDDDDLSDFFGDFEDNMRSYLFTVAVDEVADKVTVDEALTSAHKLRDSEIAREV